jgi:hypothetical protein
MRMSIWQTNIFYVLHAFLAHLAQSAGELLGWPTKWRPASGVRPHFNYTDDIFFNTTWPILMKLGSNTHCIKLYQYCSKNAIPC